MYLELDYIFIQKAPMFTIIDLVIAIVSQRRRTRNTSGFNPTEEPVPKLPNGQEVVKRIQWNG